MTQKQTFSERFFETGIGRGLRHRDYRIFCLTNFGSMMGIWFQRLTVGYLAYELTGLAFWVGVIAFAESAPLFILVALAGAVVDRVDRLKLLKILQMLMVVVAALLAILTFTDLINIWLLIVLATCQGIIQAFHLPVRMTIAPNLVPREDLTSAVGLNSALYNVTRFAGPALAGIVLARLGISISFTIAVFLMAILSFGLTLIKLNVTEPRSHRRSGLVAEVMEGLRYAASHTSIGPMLLLIMVTATFSRAFMELMPGIAQEFFSQDAEGLGMLVSAIGVGGITGAFWLTNHGRAQGLTKISLITLAITCLSLFVFAGTGIFWIGLVSAAVAGATMAITANGSQILVQNAVDESIRGRVMSLYALTYRACPAVGALLMGALSIWTGLQLPIILGACISLAAIVAVLPRLKSLIAGLEGDPPPRTV